MYDFYPEWGPARHREQDEPQPAVRRARYWRPGHAPAMAPAMATAGGAEPRDAAWERPDDN
jgi:hypothetical protein